MDRKSYVYVKRSDGHRPSYQAIIAEALGVEPLCGAIDLRLFRKLVRSRSLIFSTIDDNYFSFLAVALIRSLLGRRTSGIFLRPAQCVTGTRFYHRWKRWAFTVLRRVSNVAVLTIVPFSIRPEYARVARDWVHDPQMWDLAGRTDPIPSTPLAKAIKRAAGDRAIICFVGGVSAIKGIGFLHEIAKRRPELFDQHLIAIAGKTGPDSVQEVKELAGCGSMVVDRHVTDDELASLYGVADVIWSCYRPDYDQASGIFGRAYQAGKLSLVRSGAVIEDYAHHVGALVLALDYGKPDLAADDIFRLKLSLGGKSDESHAQSIKSMRDMFVTTLKKWQ